MRPDPYLALAGLLAVATSYPSTTARGQEPSGGAPTASTAVRASPDSLYAIVRVRLEARGYRINDADPARHRLMVRALESGVKVEVLIVAKGDSSTLTIAPLGGDLMKAMQALITVTHDATFRLPDEATGAPADSGAFPESEWRPALFVSRQGRCWLARGGLYTADSLHDGWRRVFGNPGDPIEPDELRIDVSMALVDDSTALLGFPDRPGRDGPQLYRTTNGGRSWAPVAAADLAWVDDMAAIDASVWVLGTRWDHDNRRGLFLRSSDGGATWERPRLPTGLNDISHVYRASASRAYVATSFDRGPVFWGTTDGGNTWTPIATPHDQGLLEIPSYGVRVEQIAPVGDRLIVKEYGSVFVSRADSIHWSRLDGAEHVAADADQDKLFVLTDSLYAEMLDRNLHVLWRSQERIPEAVASDVEQVLARAGVGYVSMSHGDIYQARDGTLRRVQPRAAGR